MGRPIAYQGDPNAPHLTEQERRRIKRRIANRESARRVRNKRQEALEGMQSNVSVHFYDHHLICTPCQSRTKAGVWLKALLHLTARLQIRALQQENTHMAKIARETDAQRSQLVSQMAELQAKLTSITQENQILRQEMQGLQQSLQVGQVWNVEQCCMSRRQACCLLDEIWAFILAAICTTKLTVSRLHTRFFLSAPPPCPVL